MQVVPIGRVSVCAGRAAMNGKAWHLSAMRIISSVLTAIVIGAPPNMLCCHQPRFGDAIAVRPCFG